MALDPSLAKLDPSLADFIDRPANYRINVQGGVFKAVATQLQKYHEIDHENLIELVKLSQINKVAEQIIGAFKQQPKGEVILIGRNNPVNLQTELDGVEKELNLTEMELNLNEWCREVEGRDEHANRLIAAQRIKEAFKNGDTRLSLSNLGLTSLPSSICMLISLQELNLMGNELKELPPSFFHLGSLTNLNLNKNNFEIFPTIVNCLFSLTVLYFEDNRLAELSENISWLRDLKELHLYGNNLKYLPVCVERLYALRALYLGANQFTDIPFYLVRLPAECIVDFDSRRNARQENVLSPDSIERFRTDSNFEKIISEGSRGPRIQFTIAGFNAAAAPVRAEEYERKEPTMKEELDEWCAKAENAGEKRAEAVKIILKCYEDKTKQLILEGLALKSLPNCLRRLEWIESLHLSRNCLVSLPDFICDFKELKMLVLTANRLESLPLNIGNLTKLTHFSADINLLKALPPSFTKLTSLESLELDKNPTLETLNEDIDGLTSLKSLNVNFTGLSHLPASLSKLKKLRWLNISWNNFSKLPLFLAKMRADSEITATDCGEISIEEIEAFINAIRAARRADPSQGPRGFLYDDPVTRNTVKFSP